MKTLIRSLLMGYIIFASVAALVSCNKSDVIQKQPVKTDTIPVVKYAASFTSNPVLNPDTLYARTPGVLSWISAHATGTSINLGTLAESKNSATIPAQETSTSATITLTGEDGVNLAKTITVPVYDTVFSFICKATPIWHTDSITSVWPGGHQVFPPDPLSNWVYYKDRTTKAVRPDGTLTNASPWGHLNGGAQYYDGLNTWNNIYISSNRWIRQRTEGIYTYTAYCSHP